MYTYASVCEGVFLRRINRFVAVVALNGVETTVHVKNTSRCRELLLHGTRVFLEPAANPDRKTRYSLISVCKGDLIVNVDSQIPNQVVFDALHSGHIREIPQITLLKREVTYGDSRFDIYYETASQRGFIEVKGVTLENEGIARFPDAPTLRGRKHLETLARAQQEGYVCYAFFLIQLSPVQRFTPNREMDPAFSKAVLDARDAGVGLLCYDSFVTPDSIEAAGPVPIDL